MAITLQQVEALMAAQRSVDAALSNYQVEMAAGICLVPEDLPDENLNTWRAQQTAPAEQELQRVLAERDHLLEAAGLTVEVWERELAAARAEARPTV